jgi:hypothetical protein
MTIRGLLEAILTPVRKSWLAWESGAEGLSLGTVGIQDITKSSIRHFVTG